MKNLDATTPPFEPPASTSIPQSSSTAFTQPQPSPQVRIFHQHLVNSRNIHQTVLPLLQSTSLTDEHYDYLKLIECVRMDLLEAPVNATDEDIHTAAVKITALLRLHTRLDEHLKRLVHKEAEKDGTCESSTPSLKTSGITQRAPPQQDATPTSPARAKGTFTEVLSRTQLRRQEQR